MVVKFIQATLFGVHLHFCDMLYPSQYFGSPGHFKAHREEHCGDGILRYFPGKLFFIV